MASFTWNRLNNDKKQNEREWMTCRPPCGVQVWPKWETCIVCLSSILLISGIRLVLWTLILKVPKLKRGFVCVCVQSELFPQFYVCLFPLHNHLATPFSQQGRQMWCIFWVWWVLGYDQAFFNWTCLHCLKMLTLHSGCGLHKFVVSFRMNVSPLIHSIPFGESEAQLVRTETNWLSVHIKSTLYSLRWPLIWLSLHVLQME